MGWFVKFYFDIILGDFDKEMKRIETKLNLTTSDENESTNELYLFLSRKDNFFVKYFKKIYSSLVNSVLYTTVF